MIHSTVHVINLNCIFAVDIRSEYDVANVKEFTFLQDMFEPHISILCESKRTSSGRTAVQRNTSSLITISIDLRSRRTANPWSLDQLPYDCDKVEAVPESAQDGNISNFFRCYYANKTWHLRCWIIT